MNPLASTPTSPRSAPASLDRRRPVFLDNPAARRRTVGL
jgi:hypothetical protein